MLDAVGIACRSVDDSVQFYSQFGISFKKIGEGHFEGETSTGLRIMLDSFELLKKINPNWIEPHSSGITLCFKQTCSKKVNDLYLSITELNYTGVKEPWDAFWGQRYASVLDPDGNQVDLFSEL
jgi:uncharacterized glyoxalase superfamily protein PhnB